MKESNDIFKRSLFISLLALILIDPQNGNTEIIHYPGSHVSYEERFKLFEDTKVQFDKADLRIDVASIRGVWRRSWEIQRTETRKKEPKYEFKYNAYFDYSQIKDEESFHIPVMKFEALSEKNKFTVVISDLPDTVIYGKISKSKTAEFSFVLKDDKTETRCRMIKPDLLSCHEKTKGKKSEKYAFFGKGAPLQVSDLDIGPLEILDFETAQQAFESSKTQVVRSSILGKWKLLGGYTKYLYDREGGSLRQEYNETGICIADHLEKLIFFERARDGISKLLVWLGELLWYRSDEDYSVARIEGSQISFESSYAGAGGNHKYTYNCKLFDPTDLGLDQNLICKATDEVKYFEDTTQLEETYLYFFREEE